MHRVLPHYKETLGRKVCSHSEGTLPPYHRVHLYWLGRNVSSEVLFDCASTPKCTAEQGHLLELCILAWRKIDVHDFVPRDYKFQIDHIHRAAIWM